MREIFDGFWWIWFRLFRDAASFWYLQLRQNNGDQPLPWDTLRQRLIAKFDSPERQAELRESHSVSTQKGRGSRPEVR